MAKRGLIHYKEQDLVHKELMTRLLENLMLPEEITTIHVPGHPWATPLRPKERIWLIRLLRRLLYIQKPQCSISLLSFRLLL
jgi:hypothetical protein